MGQKGSQKAEIMGPVSFLPAVTGCIIRNYIRILIAIQKISRVGNKTVKEIGNSIAARKADRTVILLFCVTI